MKGFDQQRTTSVHINRTEWNRPESAPLDLTAHSFSEQRERVTKTEMPPKSQHQNCMAFLWDEGLTIKGGAGEKNNMSGISEWRKGSETSKRNGGDGFVWNGSLVLHNLSGGDVSSDEFQPLPLIMKRVFVSL